MMTAPVILKAYYTAPEGQVHYRYAKALVKDETKCPIMFMHMSASSSFIYEELMERCAAEGYDCYAPDMPGFGASYNPNNMPEGIKYYVEVFMLLAKHVGLTKFHAFGHHSGASMATEMATLYPEQILSLTVVGPCLLTREEQIEHTSGGLLEYGTRPVMDGSHMMKVWGILQKQEADWDVLKMNQEAIDWIRAWEGKVQCYTNVFSQPMIKIMGDVRCPVLGMVSEKDILYPYFPRLKEIKPDSTTAIVQGGDWEVMKDAKGCCTAFVDFACKLPK
ncbi:hypothetical protein BP6252_13907 [Coleophoma cylindrospora]|uniref:AB hydrolase-1 domain-containing protein n=1 Tax=Coleophoma cylindrospora TaxID=1849047 RepID=A0A3D8Q5B5_9HELO|nr:hypothetical protein BP6252_13907 [Coleophoma cylindrospora]